MLGHMTLGFTQSSCTLTLKGGKVNVPRGRSLSFEREGLAGKFSSISLLKWVILRCNDLPSLCMRAVCILHTCQKGMQFTWYQVVAGFGITCILFSLKAISLFSSLLFSWDCANKIIAHDILSRLSLLAWEAGLRKMVVEIIKNIFRCFLFFFPQLIFQKGYY